MTECKKVVVLTTGGTIAMKMDPVSGGLVPAVSGPDLAAAVPGLEKLCEVDPASGLNGFQQQVSTVMDFLIRAGSYDESQKEAVLARVNTEYMLNAIAAYKAK